jgi:predicted CoA-binding protein
LKDIPVPADIIDVFRSSENKTMAVFGEAIAIIAGSGWLPGVDYLC